MLDESPPAEDQLNPKPEDLSTLEGQPPLDHEVVSVVGDIAIGASSPNIDLSNDLEDSKSISIDYLSTPEAIEKRVERALEQVSFEKTPELKKALTSFYQSNYALASLINTVISEDPTELTEEEKDIRQERLQQEIDTVVDYGYNYEDVLDEKNHMSLRSSLNRGALPPAIGRLAGPLLAKIRQERLSDPENLQLEIIERLLLPVCSASLFNEASVCITSIDDEERLLISDIEEKVEESIARSEYFKIENRKFFIYTDSDEVSIVTLRNRKYDINVEKIKVNSREYSERIFWDEIRHAGQLFFHNTHALSRILASGGIETRRMQILNNGGGFVTGNDDILRGLLHSPTVHWSEFYDDSGAYQSTEGRGPSSGVPDSPGTIAMPIGEIIATAPIARDKEYGVLKVKDERKPHVLQKIQDIPGSVGSIGAGESDQQGTFGIDRTFYSSAVDVPWESPLSTAPDGHRFPLTNNTFLLMANDAEMDEFSEIEQRLQVRPTAITFTEETLLSTLESIQNTSIDRWPDDFVIPLRSGGVMTFSVADDISLPGRAAGRFQIIPGPTGYQQPAKLEDLKSTLVLN